MKMQIPLLSLAMFLASQCLVQADFYSQIGSPFVAGNVGGNEAPLSQWDTGATPPNLPNFATAFDNFTLSDTGAITNLSWIGAYEIGSPNTAVAPTFRIDIYDNNAGQPGTLLQGYTGITSTETALAGSFYSYATSAVTYAVTAGTEYWVSIAAEGDYGNFGWGLAYSDTIPLGVGDQQSVQDFGDTVLTRFFDGADYGISVSNVPEPGSLMGLLVVGTGLCFRRRRA